MHKKELRRRLDILDSIYFADQWEYTYYSLLGAFEKETWLKKYFVPIDYLKTHENVAKEIKWYLERLEMLESKNLWTRLKAMAGWR